MTIGLAAMLVGVFLVPLALLWAGHRLRRRPPAWRGAFWGAIAGHLLAMLVGSVAAMSPAAEWAPTDLWRGLVGFWSFSLLPVAGGLLGWMSRRSA